MLYSIENGLRQYIEDEMISLYGPKWKKVDADRPFRQRPLNRSKFYELENYLHVYNFKLPLGFILNLKRLYPIRNKIAHCLDLTGDQYQTLEESFEMIMDVITTSEVH